MLFPLQGIMVAGGYNSKYGGLSSVEFLDLGRNLDRIAFERIRWRNLQKLTKPRWSSVMLINDR